MYRCYYSVVRGVLGGCLLYVLSIFGGEIPYMNLQATWLNDVLLLFCFAAGIIVTAFTFKTNKLRITHMLLSCIMYFASYIFFIILGAELSIVQRLHIILQVEETSATDNVSGLIVASLLITVLVTSMLILALQTIHAIIRKIRTTR